MIRHAQHESTIVIPATSTFRNRRLLVLVANTFGISTPLSLSHVIYPFQQPVDNTYFYALSTVPHNDACVGMIFDIRYSWEHQRLYDHSRTWFSCCRNLEIMAHAAPSEHELLTCLLVCRYTLLFHASRSCASRLWCRLCQSLQLSPPTELVAYLYDLTCPKAYIRGYFDITSQIASW
jgi:hypothetical protein